MCSGILAKAKPVVIVCTRDRQTSLPFYRDVLGLPLVAEDRFAATFSLGGAAILRLSDVADWTAHDHAVFGFNVENISESVAALRANGVSFTRYPGFVQDENDVWSAPGGAVRVAWFKDPDGNSLSITEFA